MFVCFILGKILVGSQNSRQRFPSRYLEDLGICFHGQTAEIPHSFFGALTSGRNCTIPFTPNIVKRTLWYLRSHLRKGMRCMLAHSRVTRANKTARVSRLLPRVRESKRPARRRRRERTRHREQPLRLSPDERLLGTIRGRCCPSRMLMACKYCLATAQCKGGAAMCCAVWPLRVKASAAGYTRSQKQAAVPPP